MQMFLDQEVLLRVQEVLDRNQGADGIYEFSLHKANDGPRVVVASNKEELLAINSVTYAGKTFYVGFPLEEK